MKASKHTTKRWSSAFLCRLALPSELTFLPLSGFFSAPSPARRASTCSTQPRETFRFSSSCPRSPSSPLQIRRKKHNTPSAGSARTPENTGPVSRAHNDNTPTTGARRVMLEMGDEAEELSKGRCQVRFLPFPLASRRELPLHEQIINVWRPLVYPAQDCPLAYMDYRTLDPKADLRATDLILCVVAFLPALPAHLSCAGQTRAIGRARTTASSTTRSKSGTSSRTRPRRSGAFSSFFCLGFPAYLLRLVVSSSRSTTR